MYTTLSFPQPSSTFRRIVASHRPLLLLIVCSISIALGLIRPAAAQIVQPNFPVTDLSVFATAISGNTLYLAGEFTRIGPAHGSAVPVDLGSGEAAAGFPKFNGPVYAIVSDGAGGWYIGGKFTKVGGMSRANLARVLSDFTVAPWNPGPDGAVRGLALSGGIVYVGGDFSTVGGQNRSRIAALNASTGLAASWNPNATGGVGESPEWVPGNVRALAVSGSTVYVGGTFTQIGGQPRSRIAALDTSSGLATAWNPDASSAVNVVAVDGSTVYVGGGFTTIGGQTRRRLAAINVSDGLATAWNPGLTTGQVFTITVSGSHVYVGGSFSSPTRSRLAAFNKSDGLPTDWFPNLNGDVRAIWLQGTTIYVGGDFTQVGYTAIGIKDRRHLAAFDAGSNVATDWDPRSNGWVTQNTPGTPAGVYAFGVSGASFCVGGNFNMVGGEVRNGLAAVDATTGSVLPWSPTLTGGYALAANGGTVYIGGAGVTALDGVTGLQEWVVSASGGGVSALAVANGVIYAGGNFTAIGGAARSGLAALDPATGAPTAWSPPGANGELWSLVPGSGVVYACGLFTSIGGQARANLAALSATTGLATAWNPGADYRVYALASSGSVVYAAGEFSSVGGQPRRGLAAIEASTGAVTTWNPDPDGDVWTMAVNGSTVYVGGIFSTVGSSSRNCVAAIHAGTGAATTWNPAMDGGAVETIALGGNAVFLGGQFSNGIASVSSTVTGIDETTPGVQSLLGPATPNPFGASTSIRFSLVKNETVTLRVYDVHGREIRTLVDGRYPAGTHTLGWDGRSGDGQAAVSGVYFYELRTTTLSLKRKLVLVR